MGILGGCHKHRSLEGNSPLPQFGEVFLDFGGAGEGEHFAGLPFGFVDVDAVDGFLDAGDARGVAQTFYVDSGFSVRVPCVDGNRYVAKPAAARRDQKTLNM